MCIRFPRVPAVRGLDRAHDASGHEGVLRKSAVVVLGVQDHAPCRGQSRGRQTAVRGGDRPVDLRRDAERLTEATEARSGSYFTWSYRRTDVAVRDALRGDRRCPLSRCKRPAARRCHSGPVGAIAPAALLS